jgi:hypothetical protein
VVDGSGLENRRTRKGTGGSNPSLSAIHISATAGFLTPAVGTGSAHGLELHPGKTNATRTHAAEASSRDRLVYDARFRG